MNINQAPLAGTSIAHASEEAGLPLRTDSVHSNPMQSPERAAKRPRLGSASPIAELPARAAAERARRLTLMDIPDDLLPLIVAQLPRAPAALGADPEVALPPDPQTLLAMECALRGPVGRPDLNRPPLIANEALPAVHQGRLLGLAPQTRTLDNLRFVLTQLVERELTAEQRNPVLKSLALSISVLPDDEFPQAIDFMLNRTGQIQPPSDKAEILGSLLEAAAAHQSMPEMQLNSIVHMVGTLPPELAAAQLETISSHLDGSDDDLDAVFEKLPSVLRSYGDAVLQLPDAHLAFLLATLADQSDLVYGSDLPVFFDKILESLPRVEDEVKNQVFINLIDGFPPAVATDPPNRREPCMQGVKNAACALIDSVRHLLPDLQQRVVDELLEFSEEGFLHHEPDDDNVDFVQAMLNHQNRLHPEVQVRFAEGLRDILNAQ